MGDSAQDGAEHDRGFVDLVEDLVEIFDAVGELIVGVFGSVAVAMAVVVDADRLESSFGNGGGRLVPHRSRLAGTLEEYDRRVVNLSTASRCNREPTCVAERGQNTVTAGLMARRCRRGPRR